MQDGYFGLTWKDVRAILQDAWTPCFGRILDENYIRNWEPPPNLYEHYLIKKQLLEGCLCNLPTPPYPHPHSHPTRR
jgi:hypothetical protein